MHQKEAIQNPRLVEALHALRENETQRSINDMLNEMMEARFLSPIDPLDTADHAFDGMSALEQDQPLRFFTLQMDDDEHYLMAFTDQEELFRWRKEEGIQCVVMTFDDFASVILHKENTLAGFVINPFDQNIPIPKDFVASLKQKKEAMVAHSKMKSGDHIMIAEPEETPQAMLDAVVRYLQTIEDVYAAYVRLLKREDEVSWLLIIDHDHDRDELFKGVVRVAKEYVVDREVNIMSRSSLEEDALDGVAPFYKAKRSTS